MCVSSADSWQGSPCPCAHTRPNPHAHNAVARLCWCWWWQLFAVAAPPHFLWPTMLSAMCLAFPWAHRTCGDHDVAATGVSSMHGCSSNTSTHDHEPRIDRSLVYTQCKCNRYSAYLIYPTTPGKYPLLSFAHGTTAGGSLTYPDYSRVSVVARQPQIRIRAWPHDHRRLQIALFGMRW